MASLNTFNQAGNQNPSGSIIIWSGFLANIPLGWKLCDGSLSTPDLRDRFTKGVPTGGTNPGGTGGVETVTLTTGNMSNHLHSGTGTIHSHAASRADSADENADAILGGDGVSSASPETNRIKIVNTVQSQGGGGSHNNIPQFYSVAFIQKE